MAGVPGRSGRRAQPVDLLVLRGQFRPSRHAATVPAPAPAPEPAALPRPPRHLSAASRRYFRLVVREWAIGHEQLPLLTALCESMDRAASARAVLDHEGLTVASVRGGSRAHPAWRIEAEARRAIAMLMRALALEPGPRRQP